MDSGNKGFQKGIGPKKSFLSRIRSESRDSLSEYYSVPTSEGIRQSGLDLLAGVILAPSHRSSESLCRSDFSAGSNLSLGLPEDVKNCLIELEENTLGLDDVDFTAGPCDSPTSKEAPGVPSKSVYSFPGEETKHLSVGAEGTDSEYIGVADTSSGDHYQQDEPEITDTIQDSSASYNYNGSYLLARTLANTPSPQHVYEPSLEARKSSDLGSRQHSDGPTGTELFPVSSSQYVSPSTSSNINDCGTEDMHSKQTSTDLLPDSQVSTVGSTGDVVPKRKSSSMRRMSKARKMSDILCQVCGDMAAGFYCGAYICEACKKFYMRAHKQVKLKYVCLRDKQCLVTKESRVQCQYCRYQKCLSLHMYSPKHGGDGVGPAKDSHMSEIPCRVCSAPSSGFHFGAITCEGCKGFFRRMAKERDPERYQCTKTGDCEINMITRNLCKACRYRRCSKVGMSIEGSRIGRQPNSVKHAISLELRGKGGADCATSKPLDIVNIKQEPVDSECDSVSKQFSPDQSNDWMNLISQGQVTLESTYSIPDILTTELPGVELSVTGPSTVESQTTSDSQRQYTSIKCLDTLPPSRNTNTSPIASTSAMLPQTFVKPSLDQGLHGATEAPLRVERCESGNDHFASVGNRHSSSSSNQAEYNLPPSVSDSFVEDSSKQLIKDIVEAGKCLKLLNYRVFDADLTPGNFQVPDLMEKVANKCMSPGNPARCQFFRIVTSKLQGKGQQTSNDVVVDWSKFETKTSTWEYIMSAFNDLSYIILRFAKHLPEEHHVLLWKADNLAVELSGFQKSTMLLRKADKLQLGFHDLCLNDQVRLMQSSIYPITLLNLSKSYDREQQAYNYFNFTTAEKEKIWEHFPMLQVFGSHFVHVGEMVKTFRLSDEEVSLLSALLLYPSEISGLEKPQDVQNIQEKVTRALQRYEQMHHADGLTRFGILLVRVAELVQCMLQHNLSLGLLLARNPDLIVPQLFHELIVDSFSNMQT